MPAPEQHNAARTLRGLGRRLVPFSVRRRVHLFLLEMVSPRHIESADMIDVRSNMSSVQIAEDRQIIGLLHLMDRRIATLENELYLRQVELDALKQSFDSRNKA